MEEVQKLQETEIMGFYKTILIICLIAFITYRYLTDSRPDNLQGYLLGKNVIVTGASSGIGEQFALYYAKQGANVIIMARRESLLREVVKNCYKISPLPNGKGTFNYIVADFNDVASSHELIEKALLLLGGRLDYLILNHAHLLTSTEVVSRWTGSDAQHKAMTDSFIVNFYAFIGLTEAALPYLKKSQGSICAISSMGADMPAWQMPYGTSKAAMNSFLTGIRQELIHDNINVSVTLVHLSLVRVAKISETLGALSQAQGRDLMELSDSVIPKTYPDQAAADLTWATVSRQADVYYPYNQYMWHMKLLKLFLNHGDEFMNSFTEFSVSLSKFMKSFGL